MMKQPLYLETWNPRRFGGSLPIGRARSGHGWYAGGTSAGGNWYAGWDNPRARGYGCGWRGFADRPGTAGPNCKKTWQYGYLQYSPNGSQPFWAILYTFQEVFGSCVLQSWQQDVFARQCSVGRPQSEQVNTKYGYGSKWLTNIDQKNGSKNPLPIKDGNGTLPEGLQRDFGDVNFTKW